VRAPVAAIILSLFLFGCQDAERWIFQELGTRAEFRDVFFLDAERGWIVGGGHDIVGGIIGSTTDGGRTWSFESAIVEPSRRASSFHLNAVWFVDERNGFIAGDGFHVLRTVDGGEHWHKVLHTRHVSAHLHDLQFFDRLDGWAIGSGGLVRTIDGGETWEGPLVADEDAEEVRLLWGRAIRFVDRSRGWLVGAAGLIQSTTDGGATWTRVEGSHSSDKPDLWGLDFVDDRHGWAVGDRGTILYTGDGGVSWQRQTSGVEDTLMDVDFVDAWRGWAVGFERRTGSSTVLRTTDGGSTWTEQTRVPSEAVRALFVLDAQHAWAVGEQQRRGADDGSQMLLRYEVVGPER